MTKPWLEEAKQLKEQGLSYVKIAEKIGGVSSITVYNALNPEKAKANSRRKYAKRKMRRAGGLM